MGPDVSIAKEPLDMPTVEEKAPAAATGQLKIKQPVSEVIKVHAKEYCEQTSLHGFAYFVASPR